MTDRDRRKEREPEEVSGVVYGVHVRGRLPEAFRPYLAPAGGGPAPATSLDVRFGLVDALPGVEEVWVSEAAGPLVRGRFALFRLPAGFGLTVDGEGRGVFRCAPREIRIEWVPPAAGAPHYFASYALPLWLETRGVPVLHGSAVSVDGRAVAFVGPSGVGKSVLCAELLRLGCGFLADDGVALRRDAGGEWRCAPGPPLLRLWPSGLGGRLGIAPESLPRVHETLDKRRLVPGGPSTLAGGSGAPLAAVYVLAREAAAGRGVRTADQPPREALVRLLEHGVAAAPAAALGLSARRLDLLADVAERVPVRHLHFPTGADSARAVLDAIAADVQAG